MKHFYLPFLLFLCVIAILVSNCTLDKESEIPTGATNEKDPVFLSAEIAAITHDSIRAKARLSSRGGTIENDSTLLNILRHGWAWSKDTLPTLQDDTLGLGVLAIDSFETLIPGLTQGETYHFRPYVVTGSGVTYGPEKIVLMGIPKLDDIALVADSACFLRVQCSVQSLATPVEYGIVYLTGAGIPTLQQKDSLVPGLGLNNSIFQTDLTMLSPNTPYSIRAYAKSTSGIGYSKVLTVTTPSSALTAVDFSLDSVDAVLFQGATVHFINSSIGANAYAWRFGDGATAAEVSPVHTFNTLGNMTVRLTAGNGGCILTKDTVLRILDDPFKDYWVKVDSGTFMMGCTPEQGPICRDDEIPVHPVTLSSFFIGKTEITQGQWQAVLGNNPSFYYTCGLDCPVETVSWNRIVSEFIPALDRKTGRKHRLPTEAEWEYAARGGNKSQGYRYAGGNNLEDVAWYSEDSGPHPVHKKYPNELGLVDMTGNVWEWCNDGYDEHYYDSSPPTNPTGPDNAPWRVLRGGSWYFKVVDIRLALRSWNDPDNRFSFVGFRIARQQ